VVDPTAEDVEELVAALTGGRGADYVIVTVGAPQAFEQGQLLLRRGGTMVVVGMPAAGRSSIDPGTLANEGQRILGSKMGSSRVAVDIPNLVALYLEGRLLLDELISGRYPLEQIDEAIASVSNGTTIRNVIVF